MSRKKKTHEEYVAELAIKNPNIEVIDTYIDAKTKIKHKCLIHDIIWDAAPTNVLNGSGCEICRREKISIFHGKTLQQYNEEINAINPYITALESYIDAKTPILHRCNIHNIEWKTAPQNILKGHGCFKCKGEKIIQKNRKSHEQYIDDLKKINSNIIVIENYIDSITPIMHKCLIDDYEWKISPANILSGRGCPKCSNRIHRTHRDYIHEVSMINPNIDVIGKFSGLTTPILHKCNIHNIEWMAYPDNILRGHGCYKCRSEKIKHNRSKTHEEYVRELKEINVDIKVLGKYINSHTPILHKCLKDGYEWQTTPIHILHQRGGCPQCNESSGERKIRQWLEKHNIVYTFQKTFDDCKDIRLLPFDFYLPDFNIIIEYDHKQHYEPVEHFGGQGTFEYTIKHDKIKNEYCKNNGILLLRIPYFKNVEEELNNFLFI